MIYLSLITRPRILLGPVDLKGGGGAGPEGGPPDASSPSGQTGQSHFVQGPLPDASSLGRPKAQREYPPSSWLTGGVLLHANTLIEMGYLRPEIVARCRQYITRDQAQGLELDPLQIQTRENLILNIICLYEARGGDPRRIKERLLRQVVHDLSQGRAHNQLQHQSDFYYQHALAFLESLPSDSLAGQAPHGSSQSPMIETRDLREHSLVSNTQYVLAVRIVREEFIQERFIPQSRTLFDQRVRLLLNLRYHYGQDTSDQTTVDKKVASTILRELTSTQRQRGEPDLIVLVQLQQMLDLEGANQGKAEPITYLEGHNYRAALDAYLEAASPPESCEKTRDQLQRLFETYFFMSPFSAMLSSNRLESILGFFVATRRLSHSEVDFYRRTFPDFVAFCERFEGFLV